MIRKTLNLLLAPALVAISIVGTAAQHQLPNPVDLLRSGPMLGYAEMTETVIWLQTWRPCRVQVRYWKPVQRETARLSEEIRTDPTTDHIARFTLTNLEAGTKYDYEIYLDGKRLDFQHATAFQTQPIWRYRGPNNSSQPPDFRIALGSCAYMNEPYFDRPGNPYGGAYEVFTSIAAQKPDLMLWLGDNIYYREADWLTESAMRYRNANSRQIAELKPLLAATHNYAMWDDHDFGPNDSDGSFRLKDAALEVFKDYWANTTYGTSETPGVFGRFEWGDVEFFMLDGRYHRSPNRMPAGPQKVMLGEAQMKWLMESLRSSNATFKVVACGAQMMNPMVFFEAFGQFPEEQKRLIDFIREAKVSGVMFLSGDRHATELIKRTEPGLYPLYDFTSSPLTSGTAKNDREANNPARVPGTWVTDVRNFGTIDVSGKARERLLTLRTFDAKGKELWRHEIKESELQFPR